MLINDNKLKSTYKRVHYTFVSCIDMQCAVFWARATVGPQALWRAVI